MRPPLTPSGDQAPYQIAATAAGSFSASGSRLDIPVEFDKLDRAWGVAGGESGSVDNIMIGFCNAHVAYRLQPYRQAGPIVVGTFQLVQKGDDEELLDGEMVLELGIASALGATYHTPDAGDLTLTKVDATGCAGTYTLVYSDTGEVVSGSFDVPFDCVEGSPF